MTTHTITKNDTQLQNRARILVKCPDKPGIVAVLSSFLHKHNANIIESSQYSSDPENGTFSYVLSIIATILFRREMTWKKNFQ